MNIRQRFILLKITILLSFAFLTVSIAKSDSPSTYPLPVVPDSITQPGKRANFIIQHFWDNSSIEKADLTIDESIIEQSFADFLSVFPYASSDSRILAVKNLFDRLKNNEPLYFHILGLGEKYLYNEDSPMRNEDYYSIFLLQVLSDNSIGESQKLRPAYQLENIRKNHVGSGAADFTFEDRTGKKMNLYDIDNLCDILLMFYDPDCDHCKDVIFKLTSDENLRNIIKNGKIKVVAVYSGDNRELWDKTKYNLPLEWTVGYDDGTIEDQDLYIIRSLPSIYLLNGDKTVKIKEMDSKNICEIAK